MEILITILILVFLGALVCGIVLPLVAMAQLRNLRREFGARIDFLEGAFMRARPEADRRERMPRPPLETPADVRTPSVKEDVKPTVPETPPFQPISTAPTDVPPPPPTAPPPTAPTPPPPAVEQEPIALPRPAARSTEDVESLIGRRWLGWAAVVLILFSLAFFLKYAFDNRWIGELGRVAIGMIAGIGLCAAGMHYHRRGWRVFSQMMTAGGIMLLYLSTYGAFGFYHLINQAAAFSFLAILVAEAAALSYFYNAPAIAIMALVGGFLAPVLLRSDRDQYRFLFGYLWALDFGALAVLRRWTGLSSIAFAGTHLLFWSWYDTNYHPAKRPAVLVFQTAVFLIFLAAQIGRELIRRHAASIEGLALLLLNPFVFFATAYELLDRDHHEWMGILAITLGAIYAGAVRLMIGRKTDDRRAILLMVVTALTFVTLAVPIQLRSNWITLAWSIEALLIAWASFEVGSTNLRILGLGVLGLSLCKMLFWDTDLENRPLFTPVLNRYFLSSAAVALAIFSTAWLLRKHQQKDEKGRVAFAVGMIGAGTLWFVLTVETYTYFDALASRPKLRDITHLYWLGKMAVSILWSVYAAALAVIGFVRRAAGIRWAALVLFTVTVIKVIVFDMSELRQFYRIVAFLVLGLILMAVAWGYQKAFQVKEQSE
ncbi:MAG TPA: DUF2339 domain-containing protein [Blastocatellia bacterium]|nr:DUF2339 domain-containing protein [Blastocatellia bacterium]